MKEALKQISSLVERFERNIEAYRSPAYNETQLRREFIDPFFEALGWDVANKAGYAEQYKDVVHEDAIKVAGTYKVKNGRTELIDEKEMRENFPKTFGYLLENKTYLENRERGRMRGADWYAYIYPKNIDVMQSSKILVPDIADHASFSVPLPSGERDGVRGPHVKEINAFVLVPTRIVRGSALDPF
jgi:hypothetical protein